MGPILILVDTDVLVDASRGVPEAVDYLERLWDEDEPAISVVTQMELIVGCRNRRELRSLETFLEEFSLYKLDGFVSDLAVNLLLRYRLAYGLQIPDSLIAASALVHKIPLVSKNQKHFRFIDDLTLLPYPL